MSKRRPSSRSLKGARRGSATLDDRGHWRARVFKNTFTRRGQRKAVRGWSVKIQYQGRRHTFSLGLISREAAAAKAQAIYSTIRGRGWEAAMHGPTPQSRDLPAPREGTPSDSKTEIRHWKPRLLRRRYGGSPEEFSARIECHGVGHYFSLGTAHAELAAARAGQIYAKVVKNGWVEACQTFPREITIGLHWASDPVAWTYTTLHTQPGNPAVRNGNAPSPAGALSQGLEGALVAVVEGERCLWQALAGPLSAKAWRLLHCSSAAEAVRELPRQRIQLALVNQTLPDASGAECAEQLVRVARRVPVLLYSTHEDSEQLFKSTPGGASGYVLKRTLPEHLLAPVEELLAKGACSVEEVREHVRRYFQAVTASLQTPQHLHVMTKLTPRERQIMDCLSQGYLDKEIAGSLGISAWTVHGHIKNIFGKLSVHSRIEAVVKYLHK